MARLSRLNMTAFSVDSGGGAVSLLGNLESASLSTDITMVNCRGINERYEKMSDALKVSRSLTANMKRRAGAGACESMRTLTAVELGGVAVKADTISGEVSFTNSSFDSDAGGDEFRKKQTDATSTSGKLMMFVNAGATSTIFGDVTKGGTVASSIKFTDGVGSIEIPCKISRTGKEIPSEGRVELSVDLTGSGAPVASGGAGTLFSIGVAGTALVALVINDGVETFTVPEAVILSGSIRFSDSDITRETYDFHLNTITGEA